MTLLGRGRLVGPYEDVGGRVLRRAENVSIIYKPGWITGRGYPTVRVGRTVYRLKQKTHKQEWAQLLVQQQTYPICVLSLTERTYWRFQDRFYWDNGRLTATQVYALLVTRAQREQQRIERAEAMVTIGLQPRPAQRGAIPDDVRQLVWIRDGGRCCHCGSTTELQFDHIIPVSMGGASTPENLQLLCGPCNRRKSAGLTVR